MSLRSLTLTAVATSTLLAACDDDPSLPETPEPTTFMVRVENVSPAFDFIDAGFFNTPDGQAMPGPATPGSTFSFRFHAAPGHRLSFATMFGQSNDLFYAPDGDGIALYEMDGTPRSGDVTGEVELWDAGTEVNQEPGVGPDQAPRQGAPDTGDADADNTVRLSTDDFGNLPAVADAIQVTLTYLGEGEFMAMIANVSASPFPTSTGSAPVVISPGLFTVGSGTDALFTVGTPDRGLGLERIAEDGNPAELWASVSEATGVATPAAPAAWAVHASGEPIFSNGSPDRGEGLEALAEDGDPSTMAAALMADVSVSASGLVNIPEGASSPGPITPGNAFVFEIEALPGDRLSLASMFGQSNDLFFAPDPMGLALFDGMLARSGDVTGEFLLWDAGTEVNQAPGIGSDQAPRQSGPNTGADEGGNVRQVNDGYRYPEVGQILRVTLTPAG